MARKISTVLFDLIKLMSESEKQFFIQYEELYEGEHKYLELFSLIEQQESYDEAAIQVGLYGKEQKSSKLSALKNYLQELVLHSLAVYHTQDDSYIYFKQQLQHIAILLARDLLEDANTLLLELEQKATEEQSFTTLLEIVKIKQYLQVLLLQTKPLQESCQPNYTPILQTTRTLEYNRLLFSEMLYWIWTNAIVRDNVFEEKLNLIKQATKTTPVNIAEQEILLGLINTYYYYSVGDFKQLYISSKEIVLKQYFNMLDVLYKMSLLNNLIIGCIDLYQLEEALDRLEQLKNLENIPSNRKAVVTQQYYTISLSIYAKMGQSAEAEKLIEAIKTDKTLSTLADFIPIQACYADICLCNQNYEDALVWLNKIIEAPKHNIRKDIQSLTRILILITHYELGNYTLIEYQTRNYTRFLKQQERYFSFESFFIRFIKVLINRAVYSKTFEQYFPKFQALFNEKQNQNILTGYFDFELWFLSKIQKRPLVELKKEKYYNVKKEKAVGL